MFRIAFIFLWMLTDEHSTVTVSVAGPVPQSVYQRLKKLEDRILELEGLSPEYFHSTVSGRKRARENVLCPCLLEEWMIRY